MKNTKNIKPLLDSVLKDIQPDKNYEKDIFLEMGHIIRKINKNQKGVKAILGGSGAKGTWLRTFDADIFVLFDYKKFKNKSGELSDELEKILKRKFKKIARLHGSRDYFQLKRGNFTFEIVPLLKIQKAEQAKNITDVSPLHSKWVAKHRRLINDMKLAKQFCHAQNVYGAESYIRGFSGYVCEILVAHYGSFLNLMKNAAKWGSKVIIDIKKYYKGGDILKLINTSKLVSPLVVIDPVQRDRNAAAALSIEKFEAFKKAAGEFLECPSKEFFKRNDLSSAFLTDKPKNAKLLVIKVKPLDGKADIVGGRLLKIYEFLHKELQKRGFSIIKSDWEWDKKGDAVLYFLADKGALARDAEIKGPPLKIKGHVANFKKMHKRTFVRAGRICALEKRRFLTPESLLEHLVKEEFVRERSNSIRINVVY